MSLRRRKVILNEVGMRMLEEEKLLTKFDWDRLRNTSFNSRDVLKQFGSWARMVNIMEGSMPELWKEIQSKTKPFTDIPDKNDPLEALASKTTRKIA